MKKYKGYIITIKRPWLSERGWVGIIRNSSVFVNTGRYKTKKEVMVEAKRLINSKFKGMRQIK